MGEGTFINQLLTLALFVELQILLFVWAYSRTKDVVLVATLIFATILRVMLGYLNQRIGPFPGAEVDAVVYESLANQIALGLVDHGRFSVEFGQKGYSSLLAIPYAIGGRNAILPTLVNALFVTHFLIIVYSICHKYAGTRRARLTTLAVAFYPTALLFTAIPVREAPLMWGLILWFDGILRFTEREKRLWNVRVILGSFVAFWLHSAFFILYFLTVFAWWRRRPTERAETRVGVAFPRLVALVAGTALVVATFLAIGGILQKIPDDPSQVASAGYLSKMRASKATRTETPYGSIVPSSWPGLVASLPVLLYQFLFVPTPLDALRSANFQELLKSVDSVIFFGMSITTVVAVKRSRTSNRTSTVLTIGAILLCLLLLFSVGSASVGIAMRHRAKFAWIFLLLIGIFYQRKRALMPTKFLENAESGASIRPRLSV